MRAVAVTLVVLFHAFPDALRGGFIGVDIFFVISGFLITGIIARELEGGRFSLGGFYGRRIRRIFPALIVILLVVLVLGWFWMLPAAYAALSTDVFASAAFAANIALLLQSGYFDVESAKKPLLHLWSLGIEEQFYLFWPLLLMLAHRLRVRLMTVACVIGLLSFALNVALIGSNPVATFYLPFTRAWELLAGAALACGFAQFSHTVAASNLRAGIGILLIAVAAAVLDTTSAFPGWWAVLPVAGSALVLSAPQASGARRLLAHPAMIWIGLISYPLYLWHWPLLVFGAIIKFAPLTLAERALAVALSVALAWGTYRFVEIPLRFGSSGRVKAVALARVMALVALVGFIVRQNDGFDFRLPAEIRGVAEVKEQSAQWRVGQCLLSGGQTAFADDCVDRDRRPLVFVWGDSTAGALMPGLRKAQATRTFGIAQFTLSACPPLLNVDIQGNPNCRAMNDKVLALVGQMKPDIVLLHSAWSQHVDHVADTLAALQGSGARVVVLGAVPWWKRGLPNEVLRHFMLHHQLMPARSDLAERDLPVAQLRAAAAPLGATFISAWDVFCNAQGCLTRLGDRASDLSASDQVHLTEKGSEFLVQAVIDRILGGAAAPAIRASQ
ncbi:acyltransferase family protein [Bradyrhizobium sp. NP1]|uniref:acyltransferase family protein n=1 Tax=Bradyrhizobium sp. NP1 TaxID=3049772 RepID=UPI0025A64C37|nr:acyltransferase family protein [Bradyrhizobium sp. NP1]WJR78255.1 acyltransferase family protein [Bradyrhizobium sp. NP1]